MANLRTTLVASTILVGLATSAQAQSSTDQSIAPTSSAEAVGLTEIVVTAQRREESLQKVPVAVTALTQDTLDAFRVTSIERLGSLAPNLTISTQGISINPSISIRGINSGTINPGVDPKVALYLDGVYIGRSAGAVFDLADLERVEVLRGPQGTLFGRNATAGAISLITAKPTGTFSVKQLLSYGNYEAFRSRTVVNLPALGPLSVKLSYLHDQIDGDVRNSLKGQSINIAPRGDPHFGRFTFAGRLGQRNTDAFQVAARLDLGADITADYSYDLTDIHESGRATQILTTVNDATGGLVKGLFAFQPLTGGTTNLSTKPLDRVAAGTSVGHTTIQGHALTISYNPTSDLRIKSITGLRFLNQRPFVYDIAGSAGIRFSLPQFLDLLSGNVARIPTEAPPGPNDIVSTLFTARSSRQRQISQELQASYTSDFADITGGAFYFHERAPATDLTGIFQPIVAGNVVAIPALDQTFGSGYTTSIASNTSYAGYAQVVVHLTPMFDLAGGMRVTHDKRKTNLVSTAATTGNALPPGLYQQSYTRVNYTGIVTYRPTDAVNLYLKVATGYVAGGVLSGIPFNPEKLASYEAGAKTQLFDNRLRFNAAAFYQDYRSVQVLGFANGVQSFRNAGRAKIPGFELEVQALPVRGLSLSGNVGYNGTKFKEYIVNGINMASTARFQYTSKWTGQASAEYDLETNSDYLPFIRFDGSYRSSFYLSTFPVGTTDVAFTETLNRVRPYWLVDGRIGVKDLSFGGITSELSFYGANIFNTRRYSFGANIISLTGNYDRGRTYGLELKANF